LRLSDLVGNGQLLGQSARQQRQFGWFEQVAGVLKVVFRLGYAATPSGIGWSKWI